MSGCNCPQSSSRGCSRCKPVVKPKVFVVPEGYKLPIEGCPAGIPVPVRVLGGNGMNCAPKGCLAPGDAPVVIFPSNSARTRVIVNSSPTSQGVLWFAGSDGKAGGEGIAILPGERFELDYTGTVALSATNGTVNYTATEIVYS